MDCSNARLVLFLSAENARELDAPTAKELADHVAVCTDCNGVARSHRRLDQLLGRAMRDVPVPGDLKARLLERLAKERPTRQRRWRPVVIGLAAAAALVLVVWGWYFGGARPTRTLSVDQIAMGERASAPRDVVAINAAFKALGASEWECAPAGVNYAYLISAPSLALLPGVDKPPKVPHLVFVRGSDQARMFIIPKKRFRVEGWEQLASGYELSVHLHDPGNKDFTYLVLHTGHRPDWLLE